MRWIPVLAVLAASQPVLGQVTPEPGYILRRTTPSPPLPSFELSGTPDEGLFFVVKDFPIEQDASVDAMIGAEAQSRCAPRIAFPANYRKVPGDVTVNGETVFGIVRYERLALCVDPIEPLEPAPSDFNPTPNDESDLLAAFKAYFSAFDAGNIDALMPLRDYPPFPRKALLQEINEYKAQFGEQSRNILQISWYTNPPEIHNGIFGEVLFSQPVSDNLTLCAAAMFYKRAERDFVLSRVLTVPIDEPSRGRKDVHSCSR